MRYVTRWHIFFVLLNPGVLAQDNLYQYIPIPPQELSVKQFLYHIEEVTGLPLAYSNAILENKTLSLMADSMPLIKLLDTLFIKHPVNYYFFQGQLILAPQMPEMMRASLRRISGTVKNEKTQKIIPYVNVFVPNQTTGTISNYEGTFEFFISEYDSIDTIGISCLGYHPEFIPVSHFIDGPVDVFLKTLRFQINELIVRPHDPFELVYQAINKRAVNYSAKPAYLTGFFRETTRKNDSYISLSEATIDIYKASYVATESDLIKLKKGRKERDWNNTQDINFVVEGGLFNNLQLDVMKYGVNFLNAEYMQYYEYEFVRQVSYNNRQAYTISFRLKEQKDFVGFYGMLYIDAATLGIVRAEFSIDQRSYAQAYSWLIKRVPRQCKVIPKQGNYFVEYRYYDETWNLYHARSEIEVKLRKRSKQTNKEKNIDFYTSSSEFVITGKVKGKFDKIRYKDAAKPYDVLYEQIRSTDMEFWGAETVIKPEEPLQETIRKLMNDELGSIRELD